MMIGLPASGGEDEAETAEYLIRRGVSAVRIYPTVVFRNTTLQRMTEEKEYMPLSIDEAIRRSANVFESFVRAEIPVIRISLCANDALISPDTYFAGPNHSAIGELVKGEFFYRQITKALAQMPVAGKDHLLLSVPLGTASIVAGQHACYKKALLSNYHFRKITIQEQKRKPYTAAVHLTTISKG
jgi:histone acetyltransferase (RNA polymerase elongator complex component)